MQPGKYQPRTRMDDAALDELAASIREHGVMQPMLVRPIDGGRFEIVAGERRWRAAKRAGLAAVPALVKAVPDQSALALALIENIQREDLNPLEQANGIHRLIDEFGLTHEAAAKAVGRSRSAVTNLLRLRELAKPVQAYLMGGQLDMGHARALLALAGGPADGGGRARGRAGAVGARDRAARPPVRASRAGAAASAPRAPPIPISRGLQEELAETLGAKVTIEPKANGAGKLDHRVFEPGAARRHPRQAALKGSASRRAAPRDNGGRSERPLRTSGPTTPREATWPEWANGKMRSRAYGGRILQAQGRLMLMEVRFAAGAAGYEHSHVHEQISYCIAGRFEYSLDGRTPRAGGGRVDLCAEQCPARREGAGGGQPDRRIHAGARGFAEPPLSRRRGTGRRTSGNARPGGTRVDARQLKPGVFVHNDRRRRPRGDPRGRAVTTSRGHPRLAPALGAMDATFPHFRQEAPCKNVNCAI